MWFMSFGLTDWTEWAAGSKYHYPKLSQAYSYPKFLEILLIFPTLIDKIIISEFKMSFLSNWYAVGNGLKDDVFGF